MRTAVADTSIKVYRQMQGDGTLSSRQAQVMAAIRPNVDYSLQELVHLTGLPVNIISGRCNELRAANRLVLGRTRLCTRTGRTVHPVKLPVMQEVLF